MVKRRRKIRAEVKINYLDLILRGESEGSNVRRWSRDVSGFIRVYTLVNSGYLLLVYPVSYFFNIS